MRQADGILDGGDRLGKVLEARDSAIYSRAERCSERGGGREDTRAWGGPESSACVPKAAAGRHGGAGRGEQGHWPLLRGERMRGGGPSRAAGAGVLWARQG